MYWSKSFIPTSKENPSGAKIPSHQLLIRAGMIKQESAGIYSWLPLGFKVLKNIDKYVKDYWVERRPGRTVVLHHESKSKSNEMK